MSSRSKEKVTAAIRKFFKSSESKSKESKDKDGNGTHTAAPTDATDSNHLHLPHGHHHHPPHHSSSVAAVHTGPGVSGTGGPSAGNVAGSGTNGGSAVSNGNGGSNSSSSNSKATTDSPMRRLRCVVAPTTTPMVNVPVSKPLDTTIRSRRLMKELKEIERLQHSRTDPCFTVELINDNLYEWHARLYRIDPDSPLAEDLVELNIPFILLHLVFPENFPFAPPFMRVVEPRIEKGFVMEGGAICMELLTPRGWASAYTVEAILMQFAASLVKGQGRVSRKPKTAKDFSRRSAEEAFRSLVKTHEKYGWVTPALNDG
ncbi:ubiquitin-conjugating enzyme E2Q-like protein 1 [Anopheles funestus]|uniref:ubiquitin-conjugating enzyme E2Q-like protein 1 n=1 Tax=Anopheles funestus TaxID=62324 RepID=UPI0007D1FAA3|nr:ubiquitin-conjugating enzyme E2Q-like protein 1 [Anopheles funestus]XP_049286874.1 ubiquitin-conjugating enzyme E2Q-like protein 1 [Anopheles funestus]XP_049286877.1 ubiquitin-conjugating enzyme E2Q-like protein 1 [Anopheles funestus]XP_049286878.1 ubiquitin-conjugating enzyme E2Q-like protein 1 [Anopheles funestus]XP_049286879.1 ubiquitin-conjugating enzyme E2Q-like protein 1 [Anopheles funestus]XP_049286880.1 ubiquitin-conjugating enzyme E2Q-like protein 1 [Anopheles funestus]